MDPITNHGNYDYIVLSGSKSPGIAEIVGAARDRDWDVRKGMGLSGGIVVFTGKPPVEFTVKLKMWTVEHFATWENWRVLVDEVPKKISAELWALDIDHPELRSLEIRSVVVKSRTQLTQIEDGLWEVEIKFLEFRKPTIDLGTAKASKTVAQPQNEREKLLDNLGGQAGNLAKDLFGT